MGSGIQAVLKQGKVEFYCINEYLHDEEHIFHAGLSMLFSLL